MIFALAVAGRTEEAMAEAAGLIPAAEASDNPYVLSFALWVYGYAFRAADPVGALDALRRGMVIAKRRTTAPTRPIWRAICRCSRPGTATRLPRSISARGDPQLPRRGQHHHDPHVARRPRRAVRPTRSATNPPPPSPGSPSAR